MSEYILVKTDGYDTHCTRILSTSTFRYINLVKRDRGVSVNGPQEAWKVHTGSSFEPISPDFVIRADASSLHEKLPTNSQDILRLNLASSERALRALVPTFTFGITSIAFYYGEARRSVSRPVVKQSKQDQTGRIVEVGVFYSMTGVSWFLHRQVPEKIGGFQGGWGCLRECECPNFSETGESSFHMYRLRIPPSASPITLALTMMSRFDWPLHPSDLYSDLRTFDGCTAAERWGGKQPA